MAGTRGKARRTVRTDDFSVKPRHEQTKGAIAQGEIVVVRARAWYYQ